MLIVIYILAFGLKRYILTFYKKIFWEDLKKFTFKFFYVYFHLHFHKHIFKLSTLNTIRYYVNPSYHSLLSIKCISCENLDCNNIVILLKWRPEKKCINEFKMY